MIQPGEMVELPSPEMYREMSAIPEPAEDRMDEDETP
jgi:hypothetical protein